MVNLLHFVGFRAIEISEEMKMLIMQQKMLYQKHSLRMLNFHVQTFYENPAFYLIFVAGTVG